MQDFLLFARLKNRATSTLVLCVVPRNSVITYLPSPIALVCSQKRSLLFAFMFYVSSAVISATARTIIAATWLFILHYPPRVTTWRGHYIIYIILIYYLLCCVCHYRCLQLMIALKPNANTTSIINH